MDKPYQDTGPFVMSRYLNKEELYTAMHTRIESLEAKLKAAVDALKYYADESEMLTGLCAHGDIKFYNDSYDPGSTAREALKEIEG